MASCRKGDQETFVECSVEYKPDRDNTNHVVLFTSETETPNEMINLRSAAPQVMSPAAGRRGVSSPTTPTLLDRSSSSIFPLSRSSQIAEQNCTQPVDSSTKLSELENKIADLQIELSRMKQLFASTSEPSSSTSTTTTPLRKPLRDINSSVSKSESSTEVPECPVCLNPLESRGRAIFRTTCGHEFHFTCVKQCVLSDHQGCPICRKSFSEMTPPRTPLQRTVRFPGFMSARSFLNTGSATPVTNAQDRQSGQGR